MERGGRVKPVSDKRAAMDYPTFVAEQLAKAKGRCLLNTLILDVDPLWFGCTGQADGLHHLRKRSSTGAICCEANTVAACNACNSGWVESKPKLAEYGDLTIRQGHPRWAELGQRHHDQHHEGTT